MLINIIGESVIVPKVGMKALREQQLIQATLDSIAQYGLHHTTIITISRLAGLSSGIISHYFGGKQELVNATVKHLLSHLNIALIEHTQGKKLTPHQRLMAIIDANFSQAQRSRAATKTWLSFWAQSMHEPGLARLQHINNKRLYSNLLYSYRQLLDKPAAVIAAKQTAAMIDGCWLRSALSARYEEEFSQAQLLCHTFIKDLLKQQA